MLHGKMHYLSFHLDRISGLHIHSSLSKQFLDKDRKNHGTGTQLPVNESMVDSLQENINKAIDECNRTLSGKNRHAEAEENTHTDTPGSSQD